VPPSAPDVAAWRRPTRAESRWPSVLAVAVAVVLQVLLPDRLVLHPRWLLPGIEVVLLLLLTLANPVRMTNGHPVLRLGGIVLAAALSVANGLSAGLLVHRLLTGHTGDAAAPLLGSGAAVYATNVIAFGLWYWEFDRGGPFDRARGVQQHTDFLFPQMATPQVAPPEWEPTFVDYLYLSATNATAFSPTDTLPLSRWAKLLMLLQSAVALSAVGLVIARAVNVLK
jgi:hypothetical protein